MNGTDTLTFGDDAAWLWLLMSVGLALAFIVMGQWRQAVRAKLKARGPLLGQLDDRGVATVLGLRGGLVVVASALIVTGLALPRCGSSETEVKALGIDVAIVLDASKSMRVKDIVPSRLDATRLEIHRLLDRLSGGRVALVPFAGLAFIQTPLTNDVAVIKGYLDALRVEDMPRGGTAIGRALSEAMRALSPADDDPAGPEPDDYEEAIKPLEGAKHTAIILFTDGEDHEGAPLEAAAEAKRRGIKIFTVGVGTPQGRPVLDINEDGLAVGTVKGPDGTPLFSSLNVKLLKDIAAMTDANYYHLGEGGLGDALIDALAELEKAEYAATYADLREERYHWPIIPAVLLLVGEAWWSSRRRKAGVRA